MLQVPETEAMTQFKELLKRVAQGEEVVIIGDDGTAFKLLALPRTPQPLFGSARGLVQINADFDEPLPGFEAYMT